MNVKDLLYVIHDLNEKRHNVFRVVIDSDEGREYRLVLESFLETLKRAEMLQVEASEEFLDCMLRTVYMFTQVWKRHEIDLGELTDSFSRDAFEKAFTEGGFPPGSYQLTERHPLVDKIFDPKWLEQTEPSIAGLF